MVASQAGCPNPYFENDGQLRGFQQKGTESGQIAMSMQWTRLQPPRFLRMVSFQTMGGHYGFYVVTVRSLQLSPLLNVSRPCTMQISRCRVPAGSTRRCTRPRTCACTRTCTHMHTHTRTNTYTHTHTHTPPHTHTHPPTHTHTHARTRACGHARKRTHRERQR